VYRGLELRRGFDLGAGIEEDGWMEAGGPKVGLLEWPDGGELDFRLNLMASFAK
jgi:hypothetical protein